VDNREPAGNATKGLMMVRRPDGMNAFEFAVLSSLRAAQLSRGCTPRVAQSAKVTIIAQQEIAEGKVLASAREPRPQPANE
jgi:DNA-directed RNA polymerase subunit K/omega